MQHHQPEIAHRTWQLTLATTSALLIPEDMLHLMKGEANYLVLFSYCLQIKWNSDLIFEEQKAPYNSEFPSPPDKSAKNTQR